MEMIYARELGLRVTPDAKTTTSAKSFSITEMLAFFHRLKGGGNTKLFFESSERSMCYLTDCLGHEDLVAIEISDAGRFRDYLFNRGMYSSSVKRVFSSVRAVNLGFVYLFKAADMIRHPLRALFVVSVFVYDETVLEGQYIDAQVLLSFAISMVGGAAILAVGLCRGQSAIERFPMYVLNFLK